MGAMRHRFYREEDDLSAILALVSASATHDGPQAGHLHQGDVVWGLFQNLSIDPTTCICLFEGEAGELRGFVWLFPPNGFGIHVNSALPTAALIVEMVQWAEAHLKAIHEGGEPLRAFETPEVPSTDPRLRDALAALGYSTSGRAQYQLNLRDLASSIATSILPDGAMICPVRLDDADAIEARVALHREVWAPSRFTAAGYQRLREKPVYLPELDLVAVTAKGDLVSYCMVWWDPTTWTGEFEPVGTALSFRGRGFGKALLLDALHRLKAMGGRNAVVVVETRAEGEPARRLYEAVGFRRALQFEDWERTLL